MATRCVPQHGRLRSSVSDPDVGRCGRAVDHEHIIARRRARRRLDRRRRVVGLFPCLRARRREIPRVVRTERQDEDNRCRSGGCVRIAGRDVQRHARASRTMGDVPEIPHRQRDLTILATVTTALVIVALFWSGWPLVLWLLAILLERAYANRPGATTQKKRRTTSARPSKLPRALCTGCGRTVATTEHKGVQRYRTHRIKADSTAPMCDRSRKIVGDETDFTYHASGTGTTADEEPKPAPKPQPNFRPYQGDEQPEWYIENNIWHPQHHPTGFKSPEPTADEQFGTRSHFGSRDEFLRKMAGNPAANVDIDESRPIA